MALQQNVSHNFNLMASMKWTMDIPDPSINIEPFFVSFRGPMKFYACTSHSPCCSMLGHRCNIDYSELLVQLVYAAAVYFAIVRNDHRSDRNNFKLILRPNHYFEYAFNVVVATGII